MLTTALKGLFLLWIRRVLVRAQEGQSSPRPTLRRIGGSDMRFRGLASAGTDTDSNGLRSRPESRRVWHRRLARTSQSSPSTVTRMTLVESKNE
jgi:hypothetical protein